MFFVHFGLQNKFFSLKNRKLFLETKNKREKKKKKTKDCSYFPLPSLLICLRSRFSSLPHHYSCPPSCSNPTPTKQAQVKQCPNPIYPPQLIHTNLSIPTPHLSHSDELLKPIPEISHSNPPHPICPTLTSLLKPTTPHPCTRSAIYIYIYI